VSRIESFDRAFVRRACAALAGLVVVSSPALAQAGTRMEEQHMVRVGFGGGVSVPVSDARDAFKDGVNGTGFVLVHLTQGFPALRFAFTYDRFNLKSSATSIAGAGQEDAGHSQIFGGTAGLKLHLIPGPVRPFVMAGLGAFNVQQLVNVAGGSQTTSDTNFGVDGGAGLEIKIGRISAFAEGRIQNVYTKSNGLVNKNSIQSVPVTFGIMF
jgi:opacity protein-like surface antigen